MITAIPTQIIGMIIIHFNQLLLVWLLNTGCVSAGSVSSSSTLEIFRDASRLWWFLCPPVSLFGSFPLTSVCLGQYILMSLGWWMSRSNMSVWDFRSMFAFVANSLQSTLLRGSMTHFPDLQTKLSLSSDRSNWLYRPCAENYYCEDGNIECNKGRCLCTPGYYYSVSSKTCVACELSAYTSVAFVGVFTLSFCHWHTLLLHLLVFPPCYTL